MIALPILVIILPASVLIFFLLQRIRRVQERPSPLGPRGLPFIGNLHQFDTATPHLHLSNLSLKYGPLMSMKLGSKPVIVVSSSELAKEVLKTHDQTFSSRPKLTGQHKLSYNGSDVGFAPYSESWRELRKICVVHLLSSKQVLSFRPIREEEVFRMIGQLSGAVVANLSEMMMEMTSTLICRIAFGKEVGEGESRKLRFDELMIESQAMQAAFFVSDYLPWLGWVDKLSRLMGRLDRVCQDLDAFYQELIDQHLDQNHQSRHRSTKNPNILELLISLKQQGSCSIALTWDHVKAVLMNVLVAGTDTGAATIVWTMTALIKNPEVMKKLQKEIIELVGERKQVKEDDLHKLPYLKAVIREALRLYPPTPLLLPRESMEDCKLQGYAIPAKTLVIINAWAIGRDPKNWENPDQFVPERFLNSSIDVVGQDFEVIPFGSGRRGCPGIAMGLAMVELAIANLVHCFHWEMPAGIRKEDIDTQVLPGLTMHKKNPLCLVPITRS